MPSPPNPRRPSESPTVTQATTPMAPTGPTAGNTPAPSTGTRSSSGDARFAAGQTLGNRFRIVGLLGKGGMGEVYRADDLELGTSVALKLLPPEIAADPVRLDRFRGEVRLARQISHPNVVRVYDLTQAEGLTFLSMEFVDGEDLGVLLRRIGRLPQDKAVQIARQLCFALTAAHDQGVIHRDLKPANVMIDGRGNARIMDFGVAGLASELIARGDVASGTPAYMAPEQLAGKDVSKRSDLYSLGLVLYELFTGRTAFAAKSLPEIRQLHEASTRPESLSRHVGDLDPAIERVIMRCLEPEAEDRPASAVAVAAALPGGDPLAAALAAGETPSPELIAAAGSSSLMSPVQAWGRVALIALMLLGVVLITAPWSTISRVKPEKGPEVLRDRASEIVKALGYTTPLTDFTSDYTARSAFISRVNSDRQITDKAQRLRDRPGAYEFWYRQSPVPIESSQIDGTVALADPFPSRPGEIQVRMDSGGRLELFTAVPPRARGDATSEISDALVARLFEWGGLDLARFTESTPVFRPFMPMDAMKSWTGTLEAHPDLEIRVHVGMAEGKVVYFSAAYPWSVAAMLAPQAGGGGTTWVDYAAGIVIFGIIASTAWLAARNLRTGRGDRATALRVALVVGLLALFAVLCIQHRFPSFRSVLLGGKMLAAPVFVAIEFWLFYVALEPFARRVYPQALISWTRLFRGSVHDPLVGRHILIGMFVGAVSVLCTALSVTLVRSVFMDDTRPIMLYGRTSSFLSGPEGVAAVSANSFVASLMLSVGTMLPLVFGQLGFKRRWVGFVFAALGMAAIEANQLLNNPIEGLATVAIALIPLLAIPRGGLLALVVTHVTINLGGMLPVGLDWSHWFTMPVLIPAGILGALLVVSARAASAGRSLTL